MILQTGTFGLYIRNFSPITSGQKPCGIMCNSRAQPYGIYVLDMVLNVNLKVAIFLTPVCWQLSSTHQKQLVKENDVTGLISLDRGFQDWRDVRALAHALCKAHNPTFGVNNRVTNISYACVMFTSSYKQQLRRVYAGMTFSTIWLLSFST